MRIRLLGSALATLVLLTAAPALALEPSGGVVVHKVKILDNRYRGGTITIERGEAVKWRNRGSNVHTTTSDTGLWDSDDLLSGDAFKRRFRQAGTFAYHCEIHSTMHGTITVV